MEVKLGVVYVLDPANNKVPPVEAEYQSITSFAPGVADNVAVPDPQIEAPVPIGAEGVANTFATNADLLCAKQEVIVFLV